MTPLVTIICITYNHEKYIRDALDSMLSQKTNFNFEILVHDDASTDNTAEIIKNYEKKYPNIIKPIYQKNNQYSIGKKITFELIYPHVRSNYIAYCEGDDYWIDDNKLQKQVDFLMSNEEYIACFHGVKVVNIDKKPTGNFLGPIGKGSKKQIFEDNIRGGVIHLSSLVHKSKGIVNNIPNWTLESTFGDYALAMLLSGKGQIFYIDEIMSEYRKGVENSATTIQRDTYSNNDKVKFIKEMNATYTSASEYFNFKYDKEIKKIINENRIRILLLEKNFGLILSSQYRNYYKCVGYKNTLKIFLLILTPKLANNMSKINKLFNNFLKKKNR